MLGMAVQTVLVYFLNLSKKKNTITTLPEIQAPVATQKPPISQSNLLYTKDPIPGLDP